MLATGRNDDEMQIPEIVRIASENDQPLFDRVNKVTSIAGASQ